MYFTRLFVRSWQYLLFFLKFSGLLFSQAMILTRGCMRKTPSPRKSTLLSLNLPKVTLILWRLQTRTFKYCIHRWLSRCKQLGGLVPVVRLGVPLLGVLLRYKASKLRYPLNIPPYCFDSLTIRWRSKDLKHLIPSLGGPGFQGSHTCFSGV